jgi:hypothetical protein
MGATSQILEMMGARAMGTRTPEKFKETGIHHHGRETIYQ